MDIQRYIEDFKREFTAIHKGIDIQQYIEDFEKKLAEIYKLMAPESDSHINIALVGKVGTGKSSLLNAILGCERDKPLAPVGAKSGVTTKITTYPLDDNVLIIDCPGLDDVRKENSAITKDFLTEIDIGIFVVTGSLDSSQKANYDDLKKNVKKTIVVLNRIDDWDDLEESAFDEVVAQWKSGLGTENLFPACAKGYDPKARKDRPMDDLRGIDSILNEILKSLRTEGKEWLLIRHLRNKRKRAHVIIHKYASAAASTSAAFGLIPIIGPVTADSVALILITGKMCQSLSHDVFNRSTEEDDWKALIGGAMQFPLGVIGIKALASLIPLYGSMVNAGVSLATVEVIGWAAYHLLDDGKDIDKLSKKDIGEALDRAKKSK